MKKAISFWILGAFFSLTIIALGKEMKVIKKEITLNDPIRTGKFIVLDYKKNIGFIGNKDSLSFVTLTEEDIKDLNKIITDYIKNKNELINPEVNLGIQRSPHNTELIKNSKYSPDATTFTFQLLPVKNVKGQKMVWINGIHDSLIKNRELNNLTIIADGRNLYFNFWVNLSSRAIKEK